MDLKILLPFRVLAERSGVSRIVVETREGSFGLLPNRLDCVAGLAAGILVYQLENGPESYVAVDEGVMIKTGSSVVVSVRRALEGPDLGQLRQAIDDEFLALSQDDRNLRTVLSKLESGFVRGLYNLQSR
jgi:F-type H+-transporting ATPase subunit epsilon